MIPNAKCIFPYIHTRVNRLLCYYYFADSDSNLDSDSEDEDGKDEEMDSDSEMDRTPLKLNKSSAPALDSSHNTSPAPLNLQLHKTPVTATPTIVTNSGNSANHSPLFSSHSVGAPPGIVINCFFGY